jgi:hypothetical protein
MKPLFRTQASSTQLLRCEKQGERSGHPIRLIDLSKADHPNARDTGNEGSVRRMPR